MLSFLNVTNREYSILCWRTNTYYFFLISSDSDKSDAKYRGDHENLDSVLPTTDTLTLQEALKKHFMTKNMLQHKRMRISDRLS